MAQQRRLDSWRNQALIAVAGIATANAVLDTIYTKKLTHAQIKAKINEYKKVSKLLRIEKNSSIGAADEVKRIA